MSRLFLFTILVSIFTVVLPAQRNGFTIETVNTFKTSEYPVFIEEGKKLNPEELASSDLDSLFNNSIRDIVMVEPADFWIRINIPEEQSSEDLIKIYVPNAASVKAFALKGDSILKLESFDVSQRRNDFYVVDVEDGISDIFVHVEVYSFLDFVLKSYTLQSFFKKERAYNFYYGILIGAFLLLIFYNSVLFIKVWDSLYLNYVILIVFAGFLIIPHSGFIKVNNLNYYNVFLLGFQVACVGISVDYLNVYKKYKKPVWGFVALIIIISALNVIFPVLLLKYATHFLSFIIYLLIVFISLIQKEQPFRRIKWFILPWVVLLFMHLIYLFKFSGVFEYRQAIEIGLLANIGFLALALGNKLNIYKREKTDAESKELKAYSERDRLIQEQSQILEQLINGRNSELIEKNKVLLEQQKEIEINNQTLSETNKCLGRINKELLNRNNEIELQNQEFKRQQEILEVIVEKRTKKLLAAKERAIVADRLKTSFLNNLTHEVSTPMNAITGFANLLNEEDLTCEKRNEYLTHINNNVDTLLESIDNVVILARIQARILRPKAMDFKLSNLFNNCYEHFQEKLNLLGKNNISFQLKSLCDEEIQLYADYEKIRQVLYKLLDNAVKYIKNGSIQLSYNIEKMLDDEEKHFNLYVKVEDTGKGIEEEKLNFIFEQFEHINDDKVKLYHGAGIGLAIVKGMVDILHGKVKLESQPGKGTKFEVLLPVIVRKQKHG